MSTIINPLTNRKIKLNSRTHKLLWAGSEYDGIIKPDNIKIPKRLKKKYVSKNKKVVKSILKEHKIEDKKLEKMTKVQLWKKAGFKGEIEKGTLKKDLIFYIKNKK